MHVLPSSIGCATPQVLRTNYMPPYPGQPAQPAGWPAHRAEAELKQLESGPKLTSALLKDNEDRTLGRVWLARRDGCRSRGDRHGVRKEDTSRAAKG